MSGCTYSQCEHNNYCKGTSNQFNGVACNFLRCEGRFKKEVKGEFVDEVKDTQTTLFD
jgi:hypothetical protein